jgi:hypothetical protein
MSVGFYFRRTQEAKVDAAVNAKTLWAQNYHDSPPLIEAFAEKLRPLAGRKVLFTAHSLPEKALAECDPYERECRAGGRGYRNRGLGLRLQKSGHDRGAVAGPKRGIDARALRRRRNDVALRAL